ncbi:hypothetical protein Q5P01_024073 [Channa striata]|uniref:Asteroid domain-containing protein n=1 Tax=Channa striata TaxID=64152 RepID=A0AA88IRN5_CHASR|nr:hypothetical protein Q5P01_024073 [Channa striata]
MGVAKLKKLVHEANILEDFALKNSHIVIDASSLYYFLYFQSTLDQSHGGDYSGLKDEVCQFFQALQDCGVTPHVILDGGTSPEKFDNLQTRLQNKLNKAKRITTGTNSSTLPGNRKILPPLTKDVFKQILTEKGIEFEQTFGEADRRIASLANELGCPVLSHDTDFHVYDLEEGFLPLYSETFEWKEKRNGHITAKRYRRPLFCRHFGIDPALMPVFAAIAGNDFSRFNDQRKFEQYFLPKSSEGLLMSDSNIQGPQREMNRLRAILEMLRILAPTLAHDSEQKQVQAVNEVLTLFGDETMDDRPFLESIKTYDVGPVAAETRGKVLPQWMVDKVQEGKLTSFVTDVLHHSRMMLTPLVEDFSQPSSHSAALRIRQFFYGLLLGQETCTEFDRADKKSMSHKKVRPVHPRVSEGELQQLQLQHLDQAPEDLRRHVLLEALESLGLHLRTSQTT